MPVNVSNMTYPHFNGTNLVDVMQYGNTVTADFFGVGILIAVFMVFFVASKNYATPTAFSGAMITTTITSVFLTLLEITSPHIMLMMVVMTIVSIVFIIAKESQGN